MPGFDPIIMGKLNYITYFCNPKNNTFFNINL